jgi:Topoisomerase DNA binding C4 zinc finger.
MILRKATKGENAGKQFWGCSGFPKCRYIENVVEMSQEHMESKKEEYTCGKQQ